jgi:hypothetical protein
MLRDWAYIIQLPINPLVYCLVMLLGWVCITPFLKPYYNIDKVGFEINNYYLLIN